MIISALPISQRYYIGNYFKIYEEFFFSFFFLSFFLSFFFFFLEGKENIFEICSERSLVPDKMATNSGYWLLTLNLKPWRYH